MITNSIIQKSQLERGYRLDAEYYQPEYLEVAEKVNSLPHETLEGISESIVSFGAYALTNFIEWQDDGIPFIVAENIKEGFISYEGARYISDKTDEILKKSRVRGGQVLLSMSGSVGNAAVAHKIPPKVNSNQDIVKISLKQIFSPYVLTAFLNGKYGRMQVLRLPVGSVQQHIFLWQTKSLLIPNFRGSFVNSIEEIYKEGLDQLEKSKILYSEAEDLLLKELGLKDFKPEEDLSYIVNLSDVKSAHRADAEYFQPKYERLRDKIKSQISKLLAIAPLSELFSIRRGDFISPDYYFEKGRRAYIRIKELPMKGDINFDAVTFVDDNFSGDNLGELLEGDFVFAGIGATLGKTARVPKELEGSFYSNNTARFRLKKNWRDKVDSYYLQVVFQGVVCQMQFEQRQAPTAQAKIADEELKTVLIPVLPKPTQEKIAYLVRQSHVARKKANELLEKAKREVEELIEKG
jgi:restriction endonuclease S subunit